MINRRELLRTLMLAFIGFGIAPGAIAKKINLPAMGPSEKLDDHIKDYLHKMKHFNKPHKDDTRVNRAIYKIFKSTVKRLRRLERVAGHGNFQILSFDRGLSIARKYSEIGEFTKAEIRFLEMTFYTEASHYGFFGQKPLKNLTDRINTNKVIKIRNTGNYLYKDTSLDIYEKIKKQLGEEVILTSGIRGVMKQFLLFLNKAYKFEGNLSLASRSLAPPGYSFHGRGDFDVGQIGFGAANFTERFTTTDVYKKLSELGYLKLRYPQDNMLGVRYEPWHIKIRT